MIGWLTERIRELVLDPQEATVDTVDLGEAYGAVDNPARMVSRAAFVEASDTGDEHPQSLSMLANSSRPLGYEIAGGAPAVLLRHTITVALSVQHGDLDAATKIRDAIVTDLVLRLLDNYAALSALDDPTSGQQVSRVDFAVDYTPLGILDAPSEWARLTITIDADLSR